MTEKLAELGVLLAALMLFVAEGLFLMALLFGGLLVRAAWRWATRSNWRDVVASTERKALNR